MHSNFDFFSIDLTTIVGSILNALILFLVLKHFLFDKVNAVLDARTNEARCPTRNSLRLSTPKSCPPPRRSPLRSSRTPQERLRPVPTR